MCFSVPGAGRAGLDPLHIGREPGRAAAGAGRPLRPQHQRSQDGPKRSEAQEAADLIHYTRPCYQTLVRTLSQNTLLTVAAGVKSLY